MADEPGKETKEEWLLKLLSPQILLRNLMIQRASVPSDRFYRIYIDFRMGALPDLLKYKEEAQPLIDRLERDPALAKRFDELRAMGFDTRLIIYDEPWRSDLMLLITLNPDAEARLRKEAKLAAGVRTKSESQEFDRRLDLYIKQGWGPDWQKWRELYPLVKFP